MPLDLPVLELLVPDIRDAVADTDQARTAAAVERVLASAAPSILGNGSDEGAEVLEALADDIGITPAGFLHDLDCDCSDAYDRSPSVFRVALSAERVLDRHGRCWAPKDCPTCRAVTPFLPWNVSPHLFGAHHSW